MRERASAKGGYAPGFAMLCAYQHGVASKRDGSPNAHDRRVEVLPILNLVLERSSTADVFVAAGEGGHNLIYDREDAARLSRSCGVRDEAERSSPSMLDLTSEQKIAVPDAKSVRPERASSCTDISSHRGAYAVSANWRVCTKEFRRTRRHDDDQTRSGFEVWTVRASV